MSTEPPAPEHQGATERPSVDEVEVDPGGATLAAETGQNPTAPRQSLGRAGAVMASGTLVSRMLGLVRAALLTGVIGTTGYAADGFTAANSLPNTFYLLIAGGAVNAIFVPQIVRAKLRPDGDEFVNRIITISLAILAAATVVMVLLAPLAVRLYYNVDNEAALGLATVFAVICLPQIFFYGLYTILGQVLNAHGRFAGYMWAPALANIVAIGGLVWFQRAGFPTSAAPADWTPEMIAILAGSATLSIVVQALSLLVPLRRIGFRYRPVWGIRGHGLGEVSTVAKWTFGSIVVSSLGFVVTSRVLTRATTLGVDAGDPVAGLAAFNPALLITMLLHGLITVSLITALYTRLSEAAARGDSAEVMRHHHQGMRLPSVILVPGVVFVGVMAPYVAATLFFKNSLEETRAIAVVLSGLVWLVIPMAWTYLNDRVFYAHQMTWMTFRLQCVSTGLATVGALFAATLVPRLTAFTLSIGQSLAYVVTASVGFWVLRRRHGHLGLRGTALMYLKLAAPALLTALALSWAIHTLLPDFGETRGLRGLLLGALVLGVAGLVEIGVTWGVAHALGVREIGAALEPVTRRLRRR
ncbi:MAG: murein biosynthesis integral membrane protein MurJ [Ornithinibacter sp.]